MAEKMNKVPVSNQRSHRYFADYFPIKFTDKDGAARSFDFTKFVSKLEGVDLTREQQKKFEELKQEREAYRDAAALGQLMNLLDAELFLTPRQRTAFAEGVRQNLDTDVTGFAFRTSSYYFNQKAIGPIIRSGSYLKLLSDVQRRRASDLASSNGSSARDLYVSFSANEGVDAWQEKLRESTKSQRDRLMRAIEVRVEFHKALCDLPYKTVRYLRVAGKGASDEMIASWKATTRQQLKTYEQQAAQWAGQANFSFSVSAPSITKLGQNEIWTHALESRIPQSNDLLAERDRVRTAATADFVVAMLDKELWLTQQQRRHLAESLIKKLPLPDKTVSNNTYYTDISLLAFALHRLSDQEISVLTDKQIEVWNAMKKVFPTQGQYVVVQRRNGGQMHIALPQ